MDYDLMSKYVVHYVTDERYGRYANIHTHGLEDNFGHKDLQLVIPYSPEEASQILNIMVGMISLGERFESGKKYDSIFPTCSIELIERVESGRVVLRVLIPDMKCISPLSLRCNKFQRGQVHFDPDSV